MDPSQFFSQHGATAVKARSTSGPKGGQQHLQQPDNPQLHQTIGGPQVSQDQVNGTAFKDTPQGKAYTQTFQQADPTTRQYIVNHVQARANSGDAHARDMLDAIAPGGKVVSAAPPVQVAPENILGHNLPGPVQKVSDLGAGVVKAAPQFAASVAEGVLGNSSAGETPKAIQDIKKGKPVPKSEAGQSQSVPSQAAGALTSRFAFGAPGEKAIGDFVASKIPGAAGKVAATSAEGAHQFGSLNAASQASQEDGKSPVQAAKDIGTSYAKGAAAGAVLGGVTKGVEEGVPKLANKISSVSESPSHVTPVNNLDNVLQTGLKPKPVIDGVKPGVPLTHDYTTSEGETKNSGIEPSPHDKVKINFQPKALEQGTVRNGGASTYHGELPVTPETVKSIEVPNEQVGHELAQRGFQTEVNPDLKATKVSGVASNLEKRAVENKLTDSLGDLPEYESINMKDQAARASDLITNDKQTALDIATGKTNPPQGLKALSVHQALEDAATKEGDVETLKQLAQSPLTVKTSEGAQDLRILAERDPSSAVGAIKSVIDARKKAIEAKGSIAKSVSKETATIKATVPKVTRQDWNSFIESVRC